MMYLLFTVHIYNHVEIKVCADIYYNMEAGRLSNLVAFPVVPPSTHSKQFFKLKRSL